MTGTAATAARESLEQPPDTVAQTTIRNWAMDAELLAGARLDCDRRGVRFYKNFFEHLRVVYGILRKWLAVGGNGTITTWQLAREVYPDVGDDLDAARKKEASVRRWLKALQRIGLIRVEELCSSGGKSLGLRIELLPVPEILTLQPTELQPHGR